MNMSFSSLKNLQKADYLSWYMPAIMCFIICTTAWCSHFYLFLSHNFVLSFPIYCHYHWFYTPVAYNFVTPLLALMASHWLENCLVKDCIPNIIPTFCCYHCPHFWAPICHCSLIPQHLYSLNRNSFSSRLLIDLVTEAVAEAEASRATHLKRVPKTGRNYAAVWWPTQLRLDPLTFDPPSKHHQV